MKKTRKNIQAIFENKSLMKKIIFTLIMLAVYRFLVIIPVPFVNVSTLMDATINANSGIGYFVMLLGGSLKNFSIVAIGLAPFINASIIMQLLGSVVPKLEELTEQWEQWQIKIQQYTRYLSVPLAFVQGIGMVFFINHLLWGNVIETTTLNIVLTALSMTAGSVLIMRIGELITEKWVSNGISLLIFSSIVAGITQKVYGSLSGSSGNFRGVFTFMIVLVLVLILLSIFILKSIKEIPIVYARKWKVEETSVLPIPLNPVGMIPIIFAIAFVTFPYLLGKVFAQVNPSNIKLASFSNRVEAHLNIYSQNPSGWVVALYFVLIVAFTFFYTMIQFSPEKIADNVQKRWWFVPWIRPGKETVKYLNKILVHLSFWWGIGLAIIGVYTYVIDDLPFIKDVIQSLGSLPVVVTGSGIIIIVWVVQDLINQVQAEILMKKYEKI